MNALAEDGQGTVGVKLRDEIGEAMYTLHVARQGK